MCGACSGSNPPGTRFCGHCGERSGTDAAPAAGTDRVAETISAAQDVVAELGDAIRRIVPKPLAELGDAARRFIPKQLAERLDDGGSIDQETRLVTALFADVSGFTALSTRVDAETLAAIIDPVIARMSAIVGKYEGYINAFAGDAVLALFGAPVAHEDDADRALMTAIEMHEAIAVAVSQLHEEGADLMLHIGVNTGHVVARLIGDELRTDYSVLGESVNMAQRLESAAPNGETYVGQMTWELTRDRFELEPVGELTLKGKSEPVPAWRVVGRKASTGAGKQGRSAHGLVGRRDELAAIAGILDATAAGIGGVVQLTGEPGVGKSRLMREAARHARERGLRWLGARCISYGASVAYFPYAELVRSELGISYDQHAAEASLAVTNGLEAVGCRHAAPYFTRMLGLPSSDNAVAVDELEPEAFRRGLHEAFADWLCASPTPLVFALEDVHWLDQASSDLTKHLVPVLQNAPVALLMTGRPEAAAVLDELGKDVPAERQAVVALRALDASDTAELVAACLDGAAPTDLLTLATERAAGNPFFVEELVRSLTDRGDLVLTPRGWRMREGWDASAIPPTVEEVLSGRMDMLPSGATQVLQMASVIGRRVNLALLEGMAEEVTDLHGALEQLVAAEFLDEMHGDGEDRLVFRHALVVEVAYGRMARRQRRELHRRLAETGESLYGAADDTIDLLARHFYLAEAGAKAVDYLGRAADRARRLFANDEAIVHLERAVELARATDRLRDELLARLLDLAEVHDLTGSYDEALARYEEVWSLRPSEVRSWRGMASIARRRGEVERALELTASALGADALRDEDVSPVWLERAWTLVAESRFEEAIAAATAGIEAAHDETAAAVGHLLLQQAQAEMWLGQADVAIAHATQAQQIFEDLADLPGHAVALRILGGLQVDSGQHDAASATLTRAMHLAERTGSSDELIGCLVNLGLVELRRGELDQAMLHNLQAINEAQRVGHAFGAAIAQTNLAEVLAEQGDLDQAMVTCDEAIGMWEAIGDPRGVADGLRTRALIYLRGDQHERAISEAERAAALFEEVGDREGAVDALKHATDAAERLGDATRARSYEDRARAITDAVS
ncbi:MAG: adenylate/guanylate cyclase domain-containing protein [Acidimicrobiales bacterium]